MCIRDSHRAEEYNNWTKIFNWGIQKQIRSHKTKDQKTQRQGGEILPVGEAKIKNNKK